MARMKIEKCRNCCYSTEQGCLNERCIYEKHEEKNRKVDVIPLSALEDIKTEIDNLEIYHNTESGTILISKKAVFRCFNLVMNGCRDIENKHISGKE